MTVWHNIITVRCCGFKGRHCNGLHAYRPVSCSHLPTVVLRGAAVWQWSWHKQEDSWRTPLLAEGPQSWLLGRSGTGIRPVLVYTVSHVQPSVKLGSLACLTMSNLPTNFYLCQFIPSRCNYLCNYSFDDECVLCMYC